MKQHNKRPKNKNVQCSDQNCLVGQTEKGGNCKKNDVVYVIKCKECGNKYTGETSRNAHTRSIEHMNDATSNNNEEKERSVLLRHINEKHDGKKVEYEMKVIKAYQHDPLGRQCAEAVWIKNIKPSERINNKNEFHQPGDVEVTYEKSENEYLKKKRIFEENKAQAENKKKQLGVPKPIDSNIIETTKTVGVQKPIESNIIDFIRKMREKESKNSNNENKDTTESEDIHSTQSMINDARARRHQKEKINQCKKCDFKSGSETLMKRHLQLNHKEAQYPCGKCDHKAGTKDRLKTHEQTVHKEAQYSCEQCDHKAGTKDRLTTHKQTTHKEFQYPCEKCDYKVRTKDNLKTHVTISVVPKVITSLQQKISLRNKKNPLIEKYLKNQYLEKSMYQKESSVKIVTKNLASEDSRRPLFRFCTIV